MYHNRLIIPLFVKLNEVYSHDYDSFVLNQTQS